MITTKTIASLRTGKHLTIDLIDQPMSLFIDGDSGIVFLEEGRGTGRVNGAVVIPDDRPSFFSEINNNLAQIGIKVGDKRLILGEVSLETISKNEIENWVREADLRVDLERILSRKQDMDQLRQQVEVVGQVKNDAERTKTERQKTTPRMIATFVRWK